MVWYSPSPALINNSWYKYKEKSVILQLIGIMVVKKSKETREITTPADILAVI